MKVSMVLGYTGTMEHTNMLKVPCFNARVLSWEGRVGTCELSDLTRSGLGTIVSRLYADATDVGLELQSPRTGAKKRFYLALENKDPGGEVLSWNFLETDPGPVYRGSEVVQLIILND